MGIWSWLFPTETDRLRSARALMEQGRHDKARSQLIRCSTPEAKGLYDQCPAIIDKKERATLVKRLATEGFHGWKIQVEVANVKRKKELEGLVAQELSKAGVDLAMPDVDQEAVKEAVLRAQKRARPGGRDPGSIKLVRAPGKVA